MWIKVCGICSIEDAMTCAEAGADAIGLNFYAESVRCVDVSTAARICQAAASLQKVGVFVNHTVEQIRAIVERVPLDVIQLHGDESIDDLAEIHAAFPDIPLMRAYRVGSEGLDPVVQNVRELQQRRIPLWRCLVDASVRVAYGGTGQTAPWSLLSSSARDELPPLILAGGLRPENVRMAIEAVRPWGIDVAGGVELSAGIKDAQRVQSLIHTARESLV